MIVGQPFDLIKVRMQTSPPGTYKSTMDAVTTVFKKEGPLAFYKVSSRTPPPPPDPTPERVGQLGTGRA